MAAHDRAEYLLHVAAPESAARFAVEFDEEIHSGESSGGADPEIQVLASADKETLHRALEELPDIFREVLVLREMEGMSYKEIADVSVGFDGHGDVAPGAGADAFAGVLGAESGQGVLK